MFYTFSFGMVSALGFMIQEYLGSPATSMVTSSQALFLAPLPYTIPHIPHQWFINSHNFVYWKLQVFITSTSSTPELWLQWPTIPVYQRPSGFLEHRTFSARSRRVSGKRGWDGHPSPSTHYTWQLRCPIETSNVTATKLNSSCSPNFFLLSSLSRWMALPVQARRQM